MIGTRIRQARIAAGLTQGEVVQVLADQGDPLTKAGLSKYERGGSLPKPTLLRALAQVLGVASTFFLEERTTQIRWLAFRKGSRFGKHRQERIKALAESSVEAFLALQRALDPPEQDTCMRARTGQVGDAQDAESAALELRREWKLGEQPIPSVTAAIEDAGGLVVEVDGDEAPFDGLSGWADGSVPVVVVSASVSDDRRRFSLAHELGHLFMDVGAADAKAEEMLAHRFSAAFLVPAVTARRELGKRRRHLGYEELALLKQRHGLSMQAWIIRATDLGIITPAHQRTLFAGMSARGWRKQEPVAFAGSERPLRLRQLTLRALAEGLLTHRQAERVCPGVTRDAEEETPSGALDARSLLRLPKEERDRLMRQAADRIAQDYEDGADLAGHESLSEEDHRDDPIDDESPPR